MEIKTNEIYFARIRPTAIIPSKKEEDAGYDMYANFEEDFIVIKPGETKAIPTGIAIAFSSKYYIQIEERSGLAKMGIKKSGGVFDSGYRGEYLILLYNTNKVPFIISKLGEQEFFQNQEKCGNVDNFKGATIYPYSKAICQFVVQEVPVMREKEISYEQLKSFKSHRGEGGFGHSGK